MANEYKLSYTAQEIDEKLGKIDELSVINKDEKEKLPITLGMFFYNHLTNLEGNTVEEKAQNLARYDVVVYQGSLSNDLTLSSTSYKNELPIYQRAMEINPDLKVFGYVTARGFGYVPGISTSKGMTEYRVSPEGIDHPIWTREELFAYMNLMAHVGGTRTSEANEYGNPVLTGGVPLYGVFYDDYDYNYTSQNEHLINQGDWTSIRAKHNDLIDYAHSVGLAVMPNSAPSNIFGYEATDNYYNPDGGYSHLNENDWFCLESYFLRSDDTFSSGIGQASEYVKKYRDIYHSKMLALPYIYAVSDDDESNKEVASTFALYQALCQGVDCIALHGSGLYTEIPAEFSKYYDHDGTAIYTADNSTGTYSLSVNGHKVMTTRKLSETSYGEAPDANALATCKVHIDNQYVFNNMYARSETLVAELKETRDSITERVDNLEEQIVEGSNLYHRAFIDDWEKDYILSDYTNHCFTFQSAFGGEDSGTTSSWSSAKPYDFQIRLPKYGSWRRVNVGFSEFAGKNMEIGFESSVLYLEGDPDTKPSLSWQIIGVNESGTQTTLATLGMNSLSESSADGVNRCCAKFSVPADTVQLIFWCHRTTTNPEGAWIVEAKGMYLIDTDEIKKRKTWFTNYAPPMSSWNIGTYANITRSEEDDSVTVNYKQTSSCWELNTKFPANASIFQPGETWEVGLKDIRLTQPDTGLDITNKLIVLLNFGGKLITLSISGKTHNAFLNMKSVIDDGLIALGRFTVPDDYAGGMNQSPMYIYVSGYLGGDANGLYELYVKGLYLYKVDERDELFIRGEDLSDTYVKLNRINAYDPAEKLESDSIYITKEGKMFATDFRGNKIDITGESNESIQGDWDQNDESSTDYIKNRTHYKDEYEEVVLPETEFEVDKPAEQTTYSAINYRRAIWDVSIESLIVGETYRVMWGGVEYICEAKPYQDEVNGTIVKFTGIGDIESWTTGIENGCPFTIITPDPGFEGLVTWAPRIYSNVGIDELPDVLPISITHPVKSVKTLSEEFIPDTIARVSDISELVDLKIAKDKLPIGKCLFKYSGANVKNNINDSAIALSKYDLFVYDGDIQATYNEQGTDYKILSLAKKLNPNLKLFMYLSTASEHNGYTLDSDGTWNSENPVVKIHTRSEITEFLKRLKHAGGSVTTDESGNKVYSGGVAFDGVLYDEFDTDNATGLTNQGGWTSIVEKQNALIDEAHSFGLSVFANAWDINSMVSGATSTGIYNPNGLSTHLCEDDYILFESNEYYPGAGDNTSVLTWSTYSTTNRLYNYTSQYYDTVKAKAVSYSYGGSSWTTEEREIALSWIIYNTVAMGGHYVYCGAFLDYDIPENLAVFTPNEASAPTYTKLDTGKYAISCNGHTLVTHRFTLNSSSVEVNLETLKQTTITIDDKVFINAFAGTPEYSYAISEQLDNVEKSLDEILNSSQKMSSAYVRAFIDDWVPEITPQSYTNIIPNKNGNANVMTVTRDNYNISGKIDDSWGSYKWIIDATPYRGKTLEFGCSTYTQSWSTSGDSKLWISVYDGVWANASKATIYPYTSNESAANNKSKRNMSYTVSETQTEIHFLISGQGAPSGGTFTINDLYLIDPTELEQPPVVRGEEPSYTYVRLNRVTSETLAQDVVLESDSVYIVDDGRFIVTDFNGNKVVETLALPKDENGNVQYGEAGQVAVSDGHGGITWMTLS